MKKLLLITVSIICLCGCLREGRDELVNAYVVDENGNLWQLEHRIGDLFLPLKVPVEEYRKSLKLLDLTAIGDRHE